MAVKLRKIGKTSIKPLKDLQKEDLRDPRDLQKRRKQRRWV